MKKYKVIFEAIGFLRKEYVIETYTKELAYCLASELFTDEMKYDVKVNIKVEEI